MATRGSTVKTSPAGVRLGGVNRHPPYSPDLVPSDLNNFLNLKKFQCGQRQRFQNNREAEKIVTIPGGRLLRHRIQKCWYHSMTNVSITEVNMLKNSSTLAVSVPINISIKLGFVSVNGPRETYFVDALLTIRTNNPRLPSENIQSPKK